MVVAGVEIGEVHGVQVVGMEAEALVVGEEEEEVEMAVAVVATMEVVEAGETMTTMEVAEVRWIQVEVI